MRFFFGGKRDGIEGFLRWLRKQDGDIRSAHTIRPREPSYDGSGDLDPGIVEILNNRGIENFGRIRAMHTDWHPPGETS